MASLITGLDHLRVHSQDLERDTQHYETLLGRPARAHGSVDGRPCALLDGGNVHLLLAEDEGPPGLRALCLRTADPKRLERRLRRLGLEEGACTGADPLTALLDRSSTAAVTWLDPARTRGLSLGFVARDEGWEAATSGRVAGLDHAVIGTASATATGFLLGAQLGLDLRLDLSRPEWNARLLFFRCGDLILEVFERLEGDGQAEGTPDAATPGVDAGKKDGLYGLSWRVADASSARSDLDAAGVEVSELRAGRKPGTRVFTVRSGTANVATLMLEPPS